MPASFHSHGGLAVIQMLNDTDETIFVEADTVVGTASSAEELSPPTTSKRDVQ
jgi:hypothetical protein